MTDVIHRWVVFLIGLVGFAKLNVVGNLAINEILIGVSILLLAGPILRSWRYPAVWKLGCFGILYLLSQVATDLVRDTPAQDYLRGWAKILVLLCSFTFFVWSFFRFQRFVVPFLLGYALSPILKLLVLGTDVGAENIYKFHFGLAVSAVAFLLMGYTPGSFPGWRFAPLLAGVVAFLQNARSTAGVTFLAFGASIATGWQQRAREKTANAGPFRRIAVVALLLLVGTGTFYAYKHGASKGWFGSRALEKYEQQSRFSEAGSFSLLSGRFEVYFAFPRIAESPLIGHGSWVKDWEYVYARAQELGINPEDAASAYGNMAEAGLIPAHSHIFGAWLEAGLLGGLFWIYVMYLVCRILVSGSAGVCGPVAPLICYLLVSLGWDLLFSPFGGERRVFNGFLLAWITYIETVGSGRGGALQSRHDHTLLTRRPTVGDSLSRLRRVR